MREADKGHGSQLSSASGRGGWRVAGGVLSAAVGVMSERVRDESAGLFV